MLHYMANAAELCKELMKKYNIDINHVVRHFDVNGKHCPAYFMDNAVWEKFKNRLHKFTFEENARYIVTQAGYLRTSAGTEKNTVKFKDLSDAVRKKSRNKFGAAVFKKGQAFRLKRFNILAKMPGGKCSLVTGCLWRIKARSV